jgi:hemoglobin-like flavoprotein
MPVTLSTQDKQLVKDSFQQVLPDSDKFVRTFYERLFELAPETKRLFVNNLEEQGSKLMAMLVLAIKGLDRLEELIPALHALGQRHVIYGVKQEHYPIVGAALLWTLKKYLGSSYTEETQKAWTAVYEALASAIMDGVTSENNT